MRVSMPFTVITLTNVPPSLKGDLTKWMQEIATGVYIGQMNTRIRDELWKRVIENVGNGEATLSYHSQGEMGYNFQTYQTERKIIDYEGMLLVQIPHRDQKKEKLKSGFSTQSKMKKAKTIKKYHQDKVPVFIILDIETDGLDPKKNQIIEIGAMRITGNDLNIYESLIKVDVPINQDIIDLTGITNELVEKRGVQIKDGLEGLKNFIKDYDIIGYNIGFDINFINYNLKKYSMDPILNKTIDIMRIVKKEKMFLKNYQLKTVLQAYGIQKNVDHRAINDCKLVYELISKLNKFEEYLK